MPSNFLKNYINDIKSQFELLDPIIFDKLASTIITAHKNGKKIIIIGNGGSAAIASHVAVDLTKTAGIRAINFNEADLITCFANDYGYENWVSEALNSYSDVGDVAIMISSSGKSPNIINAAIQGRKKGLIIITLSGFLSSNPLKSLGELNLWVNSTSYNIIEITHCIWLLSLIDYIRGRKLS